MYHIIITNTYNIYQKQETLTTPITTTTILPKNKTLPQAATTAPTPIPKTYQHQTHLNISYTTKSTTPTPTTSSTTSTTTHLPPTNLTLKPLQTAKTSITVLLQTLLLNHTHLLRRKNVTTSACSSHQTQFLN